MLPSLIVAEKLCLSMQHELPTLPKPSLSRACTTSLLHLSLIAVWPMLVLGASFHAVVLTGFLQVHKGLYRLMHSDCTRAPLGPCDSLHPTAADCSWVSVHYLHVLPACTKCFPCMACLFVCVFWVALVGLVMVWHSLFVAFVAAWCICGCMAKACQVGSGEVPKLPRLLHVG